MLYNLAILGRGSAAAYYLNTIDQNEFPKILVIGMEDPWAEKRGLNPDDVRDPVNYINQTAQMIAHYSDTVPAYGEGLVPRSDWSSANKRVIDQCNVKMVKGAVRNVKKVATPEPYKVALDRPEFVFLIEARVDGYIFAPRFHAAKVIVATGAGAHKAPNATLENLAKSHGDRFMDMDAFARIPGGQRAGKRVIVQGPNAAVDTADTAQYNNCQVFWLVGSTQPQVLATPHQTGARAVLDGSNKTGSRKVQIDTRTEPLKVELLGREIKVTLKSETLTADYYVWGIGQDAEGAVSFIDANLVKELAPIYDTNQRHGQAWESVEGFQSKGTTHKGGLQVVGALARQVLLSSKGLNHSYLSQMEEVIQGLQGKILQYSSELAHNGFGVLSERVTASVDKHKDLPGLIGELESMRSKMDAISPTWINQTKALAAMITNYAVAKLYFDKHGMEVKDDDLNNALKLLTPSTVGSPQLGSIRTTTAAINGFMPKYVATDANFSHDDQTMLRVFIAVNYPLVEEREAQVVIKEIFDRRKAARQVASGPPVATGPGATTPMGVWGFNPQDIQEFKLKLKGLNDRKLGVLASAKMVGTGQTKFT
jgi:hypothetical protein